MAEYRPSEKLISLMLLALDHGFNSIADGKSGPLFPFVMIEKGDEREIHRFFDEESLEACVDAARDYASRLGPEASRYAIAIDGFVTNEEGRFDAVLVEAGERDAPAALNFCQRYKKKFPLLHPCKKFGEPGNMGASENRFSN